MNEQFNRGRIEKALKSKLTPAPMGLSRIEKREFILSIYNNLKGVNSITLPSEFKDDIYYVYMHIHPETNKICYIGHGSKSRAWIMGTSTASVIKYGHRKAEHQEWLNELTNKGFVAKDWVTIYQKQMVKGDACVLEKELIEKYNPIYNACYGKKLLKLNKEDIITSRALQEEGLSYKDIAEKVGSNTMTVWRALNGRNKNSNE